VVAGRPVTLRPGLAVDVPRLADIDAHSPGGGWATAAFEQELGLTWSRTVVAETEGEVVAFAVYWVVAGELELLNVAVHPSARRQGIGRTLVAHLAAEARELGASRILLEVRRGNAGARALYTALGFVESGVRRGYYDDGAEDAVLMEWPLVQA